MNVQEVTPDVQAWVPEQPEALFWKLKDGRVIGLLQPDVLEKLPDGAPLICIDGRKVIKGKDYLSPDTHEGFVAYGVQVCDQCARPFS